MPTYAKFNNMPKPLRSAIYAALDIQFRNPQRPTWRDLAAEISKTFSQGTTKVALESETIRTYWRTWRSDGNAGVTVRGRRYSGPPTEEEAAQFDVDAAVREALGVHAAKFLAQHSPLPSVPEYIKTNRLEDMGYDSPIEAVIPFHDYHFGSFVDPRANGGFAFYNIDVARERLTRWRNLLLRFAQREQYMTTLEEAHILAIGDDFEGHGEMFGTQKLGMQEPIGFQYLGFVDDVSNVILELLTKYKHITIYKVHGNHGRITKSAKDSYAPDNIELMAWQNIADRVRAATGGEWETMTPGGVRILRGGMVDFYIASSPRMLVKIQDTHKFIIMHGHGMKGIQSTYTGAMASKLAWNSVIGETINFMVKAHLHEAQSAEHEIGGAIIQGGCFVGPSDFSISMSRPAANLPSQELFFMHPTHGKVHHETLHLASVAEQRQYMEWIG